MRPLLKPSAAVFSMFFCLVILDTAIPENPQKPVEKIPGVITTVDTRPKIQAAILLDVSSSMDGLIEQAKAQLWNMVSVMGKAKCDAGTPTFEIALYEYGRDTNDPGKGYIKQLSSFTTDLDSLSRELFKLRTNGGSEYCGQVIYTSLGELKWDAAPSNYKVIFIAGNEDFLQGDVSYTKACEEAKNKGVIVNTIYCGSREMGIREHWNLGGECGNGSFTVINKDAQEENIPTPYDTTLYVLNKKLNSTYINYGAGGDYQLEAMVNTDAMNQGLSSTASAKRTAVKGNRQVYNNSSWDLVDAGYYDSTFMTKVDLKTLPDSLKNKSRAQLWQLVKEKNAERDRVQKDIMNASVQRENYINAEKARRANKKTEATLETEIERIIKEQAKRYKMNIQ
jgi:hypothetical protein